MRMGLGIPPIGLPINVCVDIVQQAEARGFESIWVGESWGTESCTLVGALLARSQRIHVGTGIVSIYMRPPTFTAMQAVTLDVIAPGRARLGLGASTRNISSLHGVAWNHPAPRMREYVEILRQTLAGERVTYEGRFYQPKRFQLNTQLSAPMPIYVAAVNPYMLRLAGEMADGVLLAWLPARQVRQSLLEVAKGAQNAGRSLADLDVACYVHTLVTNDRERALDQLRHVLVGYCQANTYIQGFRQFGYGDILDEVHQRWQAGDRVGAEAAIPDYMVEELYIFGTTEECHDQLSRFVDAGVTLPIVASPPTSRLVTDDLHALLKAFGQV
ncbi:MAG: LLM class flavin-dependent oxidoreductase [Candidatus Tectomicrobia bacterium]